MYSNNWQDDNEKYHLDAGIRVTDFTIVPKRASSTDNWTAPSTKKSDPAKKSAPKAESVSSKKDTHEQLDFSDIEEPPCDIISNEDAPF
jgi:hypothetical protein